MTIEWPVVGGKGDRAFRITVRGVGTGRADLGLPDQPLGATATAPGTRGPPDRAAAKARDSKGAPGRISTSAGSGGLGPRGTGNGSGGGTPVGSAGPGQGTGGGGRPPAGGGLWKPLGPGVLNIPVIIEVAAAAASTDATQGYAAAAASPSIATSAPSVHVLFPLKLLHLGFICEVATDSKIPQI